MKGEHDLDSIFNGKSYCDNNLTHIVAEEDSEDDKIFVEEDDSDDEIGI